MTRHERPARPLSGEAAGNRGRLMQGATALLYFGPLLGGLAGFGWGSVPLFAAIFGLWLVIRSPDVIPARGDRGRPLAWLTLVSRLLTQVVLITGFLSIGRGFGGVSGVLPPFVAMLPVAVSFLSLPLARMIFTTAPEPVTAEALVAVLGDQPADLPDADLKARLSAMSAVVPMAALRGALDRAASDPGAPLVLRRAQAMHPA